MNGKSFFKDNSKIAKIATVIIFLALIRSLAEPFRLQYYSDVTLTYHEVKPFLIGALVTAISLLAMTFLSYYNRYKMMIAICVTTVIVLLIVKRAYF